MTEAAAAPAPTPPTEPAASWEDPRTIFPWEDNPRFNDPAVPGVCESIQEFGFGAPLVAHLGTRKVIAGHTRLRAALKLGLTFIPVRFLDIPEEKAHKLAVADNKLGELASWDVTKLAAIVNNIAKDAGEFASMSKLGFSQEELDRLMSAETGGFLGGFLNGTETPTPADDTSTTTKHEDGYLTFSLKLLPEQDEKLQRALRKTKKDFGVRTNVDAMLAMADLVLEGEES